MPEAIALRVSDLDPTTRALQAEPRIVTSAPERARGHAITTHDLRHTATVLAFEVSELQSAFAMLGHTRTSTTADIYLHTTKRMLADAATALSDRLKGPVHGEETWGAPNRPAAGQDWDRPLRKENVTAMSPRPRLGAGVGVT